MVAVGFKIEFLFQCLILGGTNMKVSKLQLASQIIKIGQSRALPLALFFCRIKILIYCDYVVFFFIKSHYWFHILGDLLIAHRALLKKIDDFFRSQSKEAREK